MLSKEQEERIRKLADEAKKQKGPSLRECVLSLLKERSMRFDEVVCWIDDQTPLMFLGCSPSSREMLEQMIQAGFLVHEAENDRLRLPTSGEADEIAPLRRSIQGTKAEILDLEDTIEVVQAQIDAICKPKKK